MALWGTEDTLEGKPKIFGRSLLLLELQMTHAPRFMLRQLVGYIHL